MSSPAQRQRPPRIAQDRHAPLEVLVDAARLVGNAHARDRLWLCSRIHAEHRGATVLHPDLPTVDRLCLELSGVAAVRFERRFSWELAIRLEELRA